MKNLTFLLLILFTLSCSNHLVDEDTGSPAELRGAVKDYLAPNEILYQGQSIISRNGKLRLTMQYDGNLVIYNENNTPIWATNMLTYGKGHYAIMQTDGNFVVYDINTKPLWSSGTYLSPNASIVMQDDGNLVIYRSGGAVWSTIGGIKNHFKKSETIKPGMHVYSLDKRYQLLFNSESGFVIYEHGQRVVWSSNVSGGKYAKIEYNGILTIYNSSNGAIFRTNTEGAPVGKLTMTKKGYMALQKSVSDDSSYMWKNGMALY